MTDSIAFDGFSIGVDLDTWPAKILRALLRRHYEKNERQLLPRLLAPEDRVIELGSALGVIALAAARQVEPAHILCYDANPDMVAQAKRNFADNGSGIEVRNTVLLPQADHTGEPATFYKTPYFLSSSLLPHRGDMEPVEVQTASLESAIAEHRANCLIIDIEGGEFALLDRIDLEGIEKLSLELHLSHGDADQCRALLARLRAQGFELEGGLTCDNVFVFSKSPQNPAPSDFGDAYLDGLGAMAGKDKPQARERFAKATSLFAANPFAFEVQSVLLLSEGKPEAALAAAREAVNVAPDNPDSLEQLSDCHSRLEQRDDAIEALKRAIAADPFRPLFHLSLGASLAHTGTRDAALEAFRNAADLVPSRAWHFGMLLSLAARQDKFDANRSSEELPSAEDVDAQATLARLAETIARKFRFRDAGDALRQVRAVAGGDVDLQCAVAQLTATPGDIRKALSGSGS